MKNVLGLLFVLIAIPLILVSILGYFSKVIGETVLEVSIALLQAMNDILENL